MIVYCDQNSHQIKFLVAK